MALSVIHICHGALLLGRQVYCYVLYIAFHHLFHIKNMLNTLTQTNQDVIPPKIQLIYNYMLQLSKMPLLCSLSPVFKQSSCSCTSSNEWVLSMPAHIHYLAIVQFILDSNTVYHCWDITLPITLTHLCISNYKHVRHSSDHTFCWKDQLFIYISCVQM